MNKHDRRGKRLLGVMGLFALVALEISGCGSRGSHGSATDAPLVHPVTQPATDAKICENSAGFDKLQVAASTDVEKILKHNCESCHSGSRPSARFLLPVVNATSSLIEAEKWRKIYHRVEDHTMPPQSVSSLSSCERNAVLAFAMSRSGGDTPVSKSADISICENKIRAQRAPTFVEDILPITKKYCNSCHYSGNDLKLMPLDIQDVDSTGLETAAKWRLALARIDSLAMPPGNAEKVDDCSERLFVKWLKETLMPGPDLSQISKECVESEASVKELQRLSRVELLNSYRNLLGIELFSTLKEDLALLPPDSLRWTPRSSHFLA